jgi:hypothetical protein
MSRFKTELTNKPKTDDNVDDIVDDQVVVDWSAAKQTISKRGLLRVEDDIDEMLSALASAEEWYTSDAVAEFRANIKEIVVRDRKNGKYRIAVNEAGGTQSVEFFGLAKEVVEKKKKTAGITDFDYDDIWDYSPRPNRKGSGRRNDLLFTAIGIVVSFAVSYAFFRNRK